MSSEGLTSLCDHFQLDLSCLVDGELEEVAATRAMLHLESCGACRDFFEDTRTCLQLNKDMSDPDRLFARIATLTGTDLEAEVLGIDLVSRLATIFYQLGKAYLLTAVDEGFRDRVFEQALPLETTRTRGRGFVDGVLTSGQDEAGGVDWRHARGVLNGRLDRIESPMEKARRLLSEAIDADPSHEEARLYLAYLHKKEGKRVLAAQEYRRLFRSAIEENNRGHAAIQLGILNADEGSYRKAIACFRWITMSGLADRDGRFYVARFNIGMDWALAGNMRRSLAAFRELLDHHPDRLGEVSGLFASSPRLRAEIESQDGFPEELLATCPELFRSPPDEDREGDGDPASAGPTEL